ncbi:ATP-binding cassette domain-containing protein [Acidihalobacter ferrooxydans]|uniref:ABC transporter ATP-binding protein n=1 Tax=Acidihalobacter ferrooxydans TaxID=1765967 RepID=A0A1P8UIN8_9GAMM|nr:ATP-binding cassette domain-containing protein [Acidihalobacter ferrooxydans]APZ43692.1 ABC transporter ATP-binding protein [Acidihalobacter ferrooxydans]
MNRPAALQVDGVYKHFRDGRRNITALDGASLHALPGRVTGLIGPDGAGKTTLMRLIAGLLRPDAGSIRVLDLDAVAEPLAVQATIGYMPQRFGLYEDLSVGENLELYADLQGVPRAVRTTRYAELLRMTGLTAFTDRLAGRLSGGMKQKLGLACTLIHPPQLLLLDEPTVGVDPVSRRELWDIVYRLVETEGMSVLLSTAYLDEAERCSEVALLHEGRVLGQDAPQHFGRELAHRVWCVQRPGGRPRHLQTDLQRTPGVLDAVIERDGVRTLLAATGPRPALPGTTWTALPPRFEDAFVEILRRDRKAQPPPTATRNAHGDETVIAVRDLTRRFGDFYAVRGVDFTVKRGEIFGLLGANGAGKSTTFRMLCGLLPPSGGHLAVAGVDLRKAAATARARIGYMAQRFSLYGHLSARQNLQFFARAYGLRGARERERLAWALDEFGLRTQAGASAGELPLGYKQRLAMACALMHEPDILFLDEPTSGVDPLERRAFWTRINALADSGVTIMVTTHFMDEAEYCDRLVIMAQGRILTTGTPQAIRAHAVTAAHAQPSMEDAFIALIQSAERAA